MEPDDNLLYPLLLLALILLGAFFTMSEAAILSLNDGKIRKMAQDGHPKAKILVSMIDQPNRFLATVQTGVTLSGLLAAGVAAYTYAYRVAWLFRDVDISPALTYLISIILVTLLLAFIILVFSELVPKRVGRQYSEAIALSAARPLSILAVLGKPFVLLLSTSSNGILRLMGINPHQMPERVTEEEIRMMIDAGEESGNIEEDEKDMINNIFEFDDRDATEMMTHRTEIVAVELGTPLQQVIETALKSGYSRIPVFEDDLDSIVGILYVKDLLSLVLTTPDDSFDLRKYMREPMYVLESTNGKTLLEDFQQKKIQMAVVVDEYGGTSGIVTMEDLLESIVGNIQDEYDDEEEDISPVTDNLFVVDGLADLERVAKFFELEIAEEETDEFETIGGYIVHCLGHIPTDGEFPSTQVGGILFTVLRMDERRIAKLRAEILSPAEEEPDEPDGQRRSKTG